MIILTTWWSFWRHDDILTTWWSFWRHDDHFDDKMIIVTTRWSFWRPDDHCDDKMIIVTTRWSLWWSSIGNAKKHREDMTKVCSKRRRLSLKMKIESRQKGNDNIGEFLIEMFALKNICMLKGLKDPSILNWKVSITSINILYIDPITQKEAFEAKTMQAWGHNRKDVKSQNVGGTAWPVMNKCYETPGEKLLW